MIWLHRGVRAQALGDNVADEDNVATLFTNNEGRLHTLTPQLILSVYRLPGTPPASDSDSNSDGDSDNDNESINQPSKQLFFSWLFS